jgi:hypothetical protein
LSTEYRRLRGETCVSISIPRSGVARVIPLLI